jgi:hypothetical protein
MIAMLVFASILWGDGTFFNADTMRSEYSSRYLDALTRQWFATLSSEHRAIWKNVTDERLLEIFGPPRPHEVLWARELGVPLLPGFKEDRLDWSAAAQAATSRDGTGHSHR